MIPDVPHPLEGALKRLPLAGVSPGFRDRVLFEAGRAAGRGGRWVSGGMLLAGMVAGLLCGNLKPIVFPVPDGAGLASVQPQSEAEIPTDSFQQQGVAQEERLAWATRKRILTDGVESVPVSIMSGLAERPASIEALIEEVTR